MNHYPQVMVHYALGRAAPAWSVWLPCSRSRGKRALGADEICSHLVALGRQSHFPETASCATSISPGPLPFKAVRKQCIRPGENYICTKFAQ